MRCKHCYEDLKLGDNMEGITCEYCEKIINEKTNYTLSTYNTTTILAEKMFYNEGYNQTSYGSTHLTYFIKTHSNGTRYFIVFNALTRSVETFTNELDTYGNFINSTKAVVIDMKLNAAIQQRIKELGW